MRTVEQLSDPGPYEGEVQAVLLVGALGIERLDGLLALGFNGLWAPRKLLLTYGVTAAQVAESLSELDTVGDLRVRMSSTTHNGTVPVTNSEGNTTFEVAEGVIMRIEVEFLLTGRPANRGEQPLLQVDTSLVVGLASHVATRERSYRTLLNGTYVDEEQTISMADTVTGTLALEFSGEHTQVFDANAPAMAVRDALVALSSVGDVEVLKSAADGVRSFLVRFLHPTHVGPQPRLSVANATLTDSAAGGEQARRQLSGEELLAVDVGVEGVAPEGEGSATNIVEEDPVAAEANATVTAISFVAPVVVCGDGSIGTGEACDDGNGDGGDGCTPLCAVEEGWACKSSVTVGSGLGGTSSCTPVCGDGKRILAGDAEGCDDGNLADGDGCSAACTVELGYACDGGSLNRADTCTTVCGDGILSATEVCDDGNRVPDDGCAAECSAVEDGTLDAEHTMRRTHCTIRVHD